jgi:Ni/Fe-hydrogenase subunit HybB-like protein
MAKLVLFTGIIVLYAYLTEIFMVWYSGKIYKQEGQYIIAAVTGAYWWAGMIMILCNGVIPMLLWSKRIRVNLPALFVITIFINIGMWFERFVIIVASLAREYEPWQWNVYKPGWVEMGIMVGSFAWFSMWFLLFLRLLPAVSVAELKEVLPTPRRLRRGRSAPADTGLSQGPGQRRDDEEGI